MDSFYLCVALGPLAVYLVALGLVNLLRRPTVVSGGRETAALGLALAGLVLGGPMQLFFPEHAAARMGLWAWVLLVLFYTMAVSLWGLVSRPRLVVYNISTAELRPILAELAPHLDSDASWAENSLALPQLEVRLHLEEFRLMRNVSLLASGDRQSPSGWRRLELALRGRLHDAHVGPNARGILFVFCGLFVLALMVHQAMENPQAIAQGLWDMLRL